MRKDQFKSFFIFISFYLLFFGKIFGVNPDSEVKEVQNKEPKFGKLTPVIKEEALIVESDIDENYMYRRIKDIAVDSRENIYILDDKRILQYDKDGKFIKTIGGEGQGPGEFMSPCKLFLDNKDNLYVNDQGKSLTVFNNKGEFLKLIKLNFSIPVFPPSSGNFYVDSRGFLYALSREFTESGIKKAFVKSDSSGSILKKTHTFLETEINSQSSSGVGGVMGGVFHPYSIETHFCPIQEKLICIGDNSKYKFFIIDLEGNTQTVFSKDEESRAISKKEKKILGGSEGMVFPDHRPFFKGLLSDEKGRIYVIRIKSILETDKTERIDIFSKDGHYLYRMKLSSIPRIITAGKIFAYKRNAEEKAVIKRITLINYSDIRY